jgi:urease accessory protein
MNSNLRRRLASILPFAAAALVLSPAAALAHSTDNPVHNVLHGFEHPLAGLDHILAMLAVGFWAAQLRGRALWAAPLTFIVVMTGGAALGMAGVSLPFVEQGILLSVIALGVLVAADVRLPLPATAALVGLFALAHGYAHGAEIPASASGLGYALGFIAATAMLHATGIGVCLFMQRLSASQLVRLAGAAIAICGVCLGINY